MARILPAGHPKGYPTIVSEPDGDVFARPVEYPDEGYPRDTWVVIRESTGEHLGCGDEPTAMLLVDGFNRGLLGPQHSASPVS